MSLTVRHNAPTLKSTGTCPSCGAPIEPDARVCTKCGLELATGKPVQGPSGDGWKRLVTGLLVLVALAAGLLAVLRPHGSPEAESGDPDPAAPAVVEEPAGLIPPPVEDPRAAFEAKKQEATTQAREQLDEVQPLVQIGETVELRRKNGLVDRGTLQGYAGTGTGRVALIATSTGEVGVPLAALDNPSRRRADPEYRKQFLDHLLSNKPAE